MGVGGYNASKQIRRCLGPCKEQTISYPYDILHSHIVTCRVLLDTYAHLLYINSHDMHTLLLAVTFCMAGVSAKPRPRPPLGVLPQSEPRGSGIGDEWLAASSGNYGLSDAS